MRRLPTLVVLVTVAAVASPAVASPTGGWTTHREQANGFTIAAPSTWIDVTRLTPKVLDQLKQTPALAGYLAAVQRTHAIKLVLADVGPRTIAAHYATTCNVAQVPTIGDLRLARDATVAGLQATGLVHGSVHTASVTLPAGKAVELRYEEQLGPASPAVLLQQFILVRDGTATAISYATLPKLAAAERPIVQRSIRSFRFTA